MPNVATVLRDEIQRLARKEARQMLGPIKKHRAEDRRAIAELKRQVAQLEKDVSFLQKREKVRLETMPRKSKAEGVRFSPKWVKADRKRLGLSAQDYGLLVGVSAQTIYNWERDKAKPQDKQLAAWAEVRGIGKREARKRLELLAG